MFEVSAIAMLCTEQQVPDHLCVLYVRFHRLLLRGAVEDDRGRHNELGSDDPVSYRNELEHRPNRMRGLLTGTLR